MFLPSLFGHTAELFRIIRKSPQPADALASDYFRAKKYIGSKERRFISELVFAALRSHSVAEHCAAAGWDGLAAEERDRAASAQTAVQSPDAARVISVIAATCLLGESLGAVQSTQILAAIPGIGDESVQELVSNAWAQLMTLAPQSGQAWSTGVRAAWEQLEAGAADMMKKEELSEEETALLAVRCCVQPWMLRAWKDDIHNRRSWREVAELALSFIPSAPLSLRVNTMLMSRGEALDRLRGEGIDAEAGAVSPSAILCRRRVDIRQLDLTRSGVLEVQDEASQLVAFAAAPHDTGRLLDACAGAGGKSLHLAVLQHDRGEITASDIEFRRLKEVAHRARRAGLHSIRTVPLPKNTRSDGTLPAALKHLRERCDIVVVDAPCSGMGTVRRMPLPKWRLTPDLLARHAAKQRAVLDTYAACVRPGGVLIYSTCSVMPQENDEVVEAFLAGHDEFMPDPLAPVFGPANVNVVLSDPGRATVTLTPAVHGTDGFFVARMRRRP